MIEWNQSLLLRKTGRDIHWWADLARQQGFADNEALAAWMRDEHGVTGYAQYAVSWEVFGYPEFMLRDADELFDGQYADSPTKPWIPDCEVTLMITPSPRAFMAGTTARA